MSFLIVIGVLIGIGVTLYGALTVREVDQTTTARLNRFDVKPAATLTDLELQIPRRERLLGPARRQLAQHQRHLYRHGVVAHPHRLDRRPLPVGRAGADDEDRAHH